MREELGFFHILLALGLSLGLEFAQEFQISLQVAVDALFINCQKRELRGLC